MHLAAQALRIERQTGRPQHRVGQQGGSQPFPVRRCYLRTARFLPHQLRLALRNVPVGIDPDGPDIGGQSAILYSIGAQLMDRQHQGNTSLVWQRTAYPAKRDAITVSERQTGAVDSLMEIALLPFLLRQDRLYN